ncbi:M81 family metallopeptidase [Marinihelvus fidelis]|uniref:M81 family metallopeptidase n=1 Tax=Marinihelvus fidelis TaxID=2613842 RepID=UPI001783DB0F|nr:M81 family metallopeptidase [Marinihelvus fidelis]
MKVFAAYLAHETNSFSPLPTDLDSFRELGIHRAGMDPEAAGNPLKVAAGFYAEARRRGDDITVGLCAHAQPSQPTRQADYEQLRDALLDDLRGALDGLDMVLLMMHGSMLAEGCDDCEADVLAHVRNLVGPDLPVGLLLDLHCNISPAMLRHATVIKACKEYPHTDFDARARELYDICARVVTGDARPVMAFQPLPMFGLFQTARQPMRGLVDHALALEQQPGVLSITLAHGFPWSDVAYSGAGVIAVTDNDPVLAAEIAADTGRTFFAQRQAGQVPLDGIDPCLDRALAAPPGTVVIADMSDNPGGGAGSDSTFILQRVLERGIGNCLFAYFWDPAALDAAFAAGESATLALAIGGKAGPDSGQPVELQVTVRALRTEATQAHIADGEPTALGRTALVSGAGVDIILNDIRQQPFTPEGLQACGARPWDKRLVVVKSSHHFHAGFHQRAAAIIHCDAPGLLNADARARPYTAIRRPVWPLDDIDETALPPVMTC